MDTSRPQPRLTLLNADHRQQVHQAALRILATTGVRIDSPAALALLRTRLGADCLVGTTLRLPAEVVTAAIASAPHKVQLFDRLGQPAFQVGDGRMHFGIGVTALYYMDPLSDALQPFARPHLGAMVRLASSLPQYECISTVGILQDVPSRRADLVATVEMLANTTRPLVLLISDEAQFTPVLDLCAHIVGDLGTHPCLVPYLNPLTPLVMSADTLNKMLAAIPRGLPVIFSSYSMAGMTTPLPPAGTLVLLLAELLAGLVISQVIRPGAPVLLGTLPDYFDMKTMQSFYDPQSFLINLACAEMMAEYGLPHCGTSGSGTGWGADLPAADTYWQNTLTSVLSPGGLAPFVGDTLGAKAFSPNTVVYVHEVIDQALRFATGFSLGESAALLEEIALAGPGGSFLSAPSTRRAFRDGYYPSPLFPRWSMEKWQAEGAPQAQDLLRRHTARLVESAPPPADASDLLARGAAFIKGLS